MKEKTIIDEQYYLNEKLIFEEIGKSKQFKMESRIIENAERKLTDAIGKENEELLYDCLTAYNDKTITMMRIAFKYGFSLANKIFIESLKA